jgi:hypothetical protein
MPCRCSDGSFVHGQFLDFAPLDLKDAAVSAPQNKYHGFIPCVCNIPGLGSNVYRFQTNLCWAFILA